MTRGKLLIGLLIAVFILLIAIPAFHRFMFVLWPNTVLFICAALVASTIGFIIYGMIKGFKNTFPNE